MAESIELLQQELAFHKEEVSRMRRKLDGALSKLDTMDGAQAARDKGGDWVKKLAPVAIGLVAAAVGSLLWGRIESIAEKQVEMRVIDGSRDKEVERINARLVKLENKKSDDLGPLEARVVSAEANITRLDSAVYEHEEEIDDLEDDVKGQSKDLSSISASATASFTEVETQIRATWDVVNTMEGYNRQTDGLLWRKVFDEDLPDNEYFSTNIPAQATTQIGKVNGD